jgi:hypothetical protein
MVLQEREVSMFYPLDIFKTESDGGVLWRGAAETLVAAKACIKKKKNSLSLPPVSISSSTNTQDTAFASCGRMFLHSSAIEGIPAGNTLAEIKLNYERQRDKEFESHVCAKYSVRNVRPTL